MSAPEVLVAVTFVGLGSLAGLALPEVWIHAGVAPGTLMLTGGLVYIAGAWSYHRRRPDPFPAVFGYHEVFHACVCAAATCQYLSITLITARIASLEGAADMSLGSDLAGGGNAMKISRGRAPPFGRGALSASGPCNSKKL